MKEKKRLNEKKVKPEKEVKNKKKVNNDKKVKNKEKIKNEKKIKTEKKVKTKNKESKTKKLDIKKCFEKTGNVLRKKWLVNSSKTLLLIAIIIGIYIGVNIILEKAVLPEIDFTEDKIYSLSDESRDKIGNIEKEINITLINYSESKAFISFIERYIELNKNIKLEKIDDLSARTDLMTKYSLEATDSLIIVACGENEKTLMDYDLYTYDYTTNQQVDRTEEAITNAIIDVTIEEKPKIYFMSNHVMYDIRYYSTIMQTLVDEANEVETLDIISKGEIPVDCDCLVISTLKEDLTEQERDKIIEYIKNGGEMLLMCGPNINNVSLTNFQKVLDEYGLTIGNGVIFEGNSANMVSGYSDFIIETTQSTSLTKNINMSMNLCFIDAGKITFNEEKLEELGIEYETLATTTDKAFERTDITQSSTIRTQKDSEGGSCMVAAIATKTIEEGKTSKLIVFSNELFAMDMPVQLNGYTMYTVSLYNNEDMILNSISYLNEREDTITIRKDNEQVTYTVTEQQNLIIMAIIFILPVLIIIAGIVVWQVRRRKK